MHNTAELQVLSSRSITQRDGVLAAPKPFDVISKILASLTPLIAELERFWDWANARLFGGQLPRRPIITVEPRRRRHGNGWFTAGCWRKTGTSSERPDEIVLAAEHLAEPPIEILHTLLRAMVSQANAQAGRRDVHPQGRYHTRHFKREAEGRGLRVERDGWRGWNRTILTPVTRRLILEEFRPEAAKFTAFRPALALAGGKAKRHLWRCQCPIQFRRPHLNILCRDCGALFERVERARRRGQGTTTKPPARQLT
jgi:hypothetical protein